MAMLARRPLKTQFIMSFALIILLTLVSTGILTWGVFQVLGRMENTRFFPANYYEKQIPNLEARIRELGSTILADESILWELVPHGGITYQAFDAEGRVLYGTEQGEIVSGPDELLQLINTTHRQQDDFIRLVPLFSGRRLEGAVALVYELAPYYPVERDRILLGWLPYLLVIAPVAFVVLFTILFARRFARNLGEPVNMLIEASHKLQARDLDFDIPYTANNELGQLCRSFNEMKDALKESLTSQWQAEQRRREMVAALAHDLKTPFTIIQGYAEALLRQTEEGTKESRYLKVIADSAHRGGGLVQEMLFAAELEESEGRAVAEVDIGRFLQEKLEVYQGLGKNVDITVELELSGFTGHSSLVKADQSALNRILDNIVMNSLQHTPAGGTITVTVQLEGQALRFTVRDTGPGFTAQDLHHLFEKFYRGDQSRSTKGGSGLGLYIVKQLVERQGGSVRAWNHPDGGACLEFYLPIIY